MTEHPLEKHITKLAKHHAHVRAHHREAAEGHAAERDSGQLQTGTPGEARLAGADTEGTEHEQG